MNINKKIEFLIFKIFFSERKVDNVLDFKFIKYYH